MGFRFSREEKDAYLGLIDSITYDGERLVGMKSCRVKKRRNG